MVVVKEAVRQVIDFLLAEDGRNNSTNLVPAEISESGDDTGLGEKRIKIFQAELRVVGETIPCTINIHAKSNIVELRVLKPSSDDGLARYRGLIRTFLPIRNINQEKSPIEVGFCWRFGNDVTSHLSLSRVPIERTGAVKDPSVQIGQFAQGLEKMFEGKIKLNMESLAEMKDTI